MRSSGYWSSSWSVPCTLMTFGGSLTIEPVGGGTPAPAGLERAVGVRHTSSLYAGGAAMTIAHQGRYDQIGEGSFVFEPFDGWGSYSADGCYRRGTGLQAGDVYGFRMTGDFTLRYDDPAHARDAKGTATRTFNGTTGAVAPCSGTDPCIRAQT